MMVATLGLAFMAAGLPKARPTHRIGNNNQAVSQMPL
jgi:hypothetical protein